MCGDCVIGWLLFCFDEVVSACDGSDFVDAVAYSILAVIKRRSSPSRRRERTIGLEVRRRNRVCKDFVSFRGDWLCPLPCTGLRAR